MENTRPMERTNEDREVREANLVQNIIWPQAMSRIKNNERKLLRIEILVVSYILHYSCGRVGFRPHTRAHFYHFLIIVDYLQSLFLFFYVTRFELYLSVWSVSYSVRVYKYTSNSTSSKKNKKF